MRLEVLRAVVMAVSAAGIAGMIVGSVAGNNNGAVVTCGLVTAVGILVLMAVTAATRGAAAAGGAAGGNGYDDVLAARVEDRIQAVLAHGADEGAVRDLVRDAVRLGRSTTARQAAAGR